MDVTWTTTQKQRLSELNADETLHDCVFPNTVEREKKFKKLERELARENRDELLALKNDTLRPLLCRLESRLVDRLTQEGFVQVVTPILLSKGMLYKMTITSDHPLVKQVFWVDKDKCLRPMLAPNLYSLLRDLRRLWGKPVRIFEVGPCFRKESQGAYHLNEFTMLNLVELNDIDGQQEERLSELAAIAMDAVGITNYRLEKDECHVYGNTIDVMSGDLELGSGAYGPHKLDDAWGIIDPWVGIGFGLERLVVTVKGHKNIHRAGRSLSYLDGARLNI
ncbi:MAG: pyrrolysine--tRNA(Pyl) ligase large subunit [Desulfitobacteriaceae bacterium]|nr:pyrrolysine--tRNA(Pyl) ligase large subunit [Desulfitobacteriaceae bacterium]